MRQLKTLCVGVSGRGQWPLKTCAPDNGFEVSAVCDLSEDALTAAQKITGLDASACYTDYSEALNKSGVEAAIICTPTPFHCPFAKQAIEAGLPVLVEKGMAPNWDTAKDMIDFVRGQDAVFCVSQNYRYAALERTIQRVIGDETDPCYVGEVFLIDFHHHRVRPIPRTLNYPHASIWELSCHHFDDLTLWLGPVAEVTAHASRSDWSAYEHPANTSAFLRFANGASVNYHHGHDSSRGALNIGIHGERGAVLGGVLDQTSNTSGVDALQYTPRSALQFGTTEPYEVTFDDHLGESGVLSDFRAYIDGGPEPGISGYQNLEVMAMCQMVVMSVEQGRTIKRDELP